MSACPELHSKNQMGCLSKGSPYCIARYRAAIWRTYPGIPGCLRGNKVLYFMRHTAYGFLNSCQREQRKEKTVPFGCMRHRIQIPATENVGIWRKKGQVEIDG